MKIEKTIRMPKALLKKWLKALRSGKYKQGQGRLGNAKEGYCCLGLLTRVADGRVEDSSAEEPSVEWCVKHRVSHKFFNGEWSNDCFDPRIADDSEGYVTKRASYLNDEPGLSFKEIADLIEQRAEGI